MSSKKKDIANIVVSVVLMYGFFVLCIFKTPDEVSESERRHLAMRPAFDVENGDFMDEFEKYVADQFPFREKFRTLHATFLKYGINKKENNGIYVVGRHICKLDDKLNENCVEWSINRINYINEKYLRDSQVYFAIIPDKNYYLARKNGYPYFDYESFEDRFKEETRDYARYVDIKNVLSLEDYYYTDTHWRQEKLEAVTDILLDSMGKESDFKLKQIVASNEFAGVYYGQAALPLKKDTMSYLGGGYIDTLIVKCFDSGKEEIQPVYDFEMLEGLDPYEFYLSGSKALITIENPNAKTQDELVLFRDSFGSSIAPLLANSYSKVTLIDIRYINPAILEKFVDFEGKDVLFLYNAQVLNNMCPN